MADDAIRLGGQGVLGTSDRQCTTAQHLDLTPQLYDTSPYPVVSSGACGDIYTARIKGSGGLVALKRLRIRGGLRDQDNSMLRLNKVCATSSMF